MSTPQFCVSCETYKANIYNGLSSLQQKQEFVDMTLAADGHFVKVHQVVVSLASPYLKELILSAPCPHPVVFLNKISYPILCYILEYIYSGEVMVNKDILSEFVAAGKELHIKGLHDMELQFQQDLILKKKQIGQKKTFIVEQQQQSESQPTVHKYGVIGGQELSSNGKSFDETMNDPFANEEEEKHHHADDDDDDDDKSELQCSQMKLSQNIANITFAQSPKNVASTNEQNTKILQYTLSNQGHLQLILNRFMYHLNYCYKNSPVRSWRCIDAKINKCPASVTTKDDVVVRRVAAHKHGFHDKKIMKKLQHSAIFTAIKDAEDRELNKQNTLRNT